MNPLKILQDERIEIVSHLKHSFRSGIARDVFQGMTSPQKYIPSKYFYDRQGSQLFERICSLPEYYPTRTEMVILKQAAPVIMKSFTGGDLVELGSGANRKIRLFLDAVDEYERKKMRYVPVDVSEAALVKAAEELLGIYPTLKVLGIVADFTQHMDVLPSEGPRLILFLGSTIGNFDRLSRVRFLKRVARSMRPSDRFIIGFDMIKSRGTLEAAYNDSRGVTSQFNKNVLRVVNRELNADFDPSSFEHVAFFNEDRQRVEMHLLARKKCEVRIRDLDLIVDIDENETIHTEECNKFSGEGIENMVRQAGLEIRQWHTDRKGWFSLTELSLPR